MNQASVKYYMTPAGFNRLSEEHKHLLHTERPEVTKVVAWAAGNGDRSENADYHYGKKRLREIDKRLRFLGKRLDSAVVVDPLKIESEKIQFGATVEVEDENGQNKTFQIVGVDEIKPEIGRISYLSPIGKALIGKEEGDSIEVQTPKGLIEFEILSITYKEIGEE